MFLYSGKMIGDLGNYDLCTRDPSMRYYVFFIHLQSQVGGVASGICLPAECDVEIVQTLATKYLSPQLAQAGLVAEADEPKEKLPKELDKGAIVSIALFSALGVLSAVGAIVQYTSLGDASDLSHLDSHARAAMPPQEQMRSKKSWAQALLAFSFRTT